jgi:ATP-binding cassette subfamily A (ABC1) protein 3
LQVISGMQLTAYWTANFVVDMLKLQPLLWTTILIFNIENLHYEAAWLTYLLLPFAILPFTYVTSFIFTSDNAAQAYTLFGHFVSILTLPLFVYIFRMTPQLEQKGDDLNVIFNMFPSYGIASSVFADALGGNLA